MLVYIYRIYSIQYIPVYTVYTCLGKKMNIYRYILYFPFAPDYSTVYTRRYCTSGIAGIVPMQCKSLLDKDSRLDEPLQTFSVGIYFLKAQPLWHAWVIGYSRY